MDGFMTNKAKILVLFANAYDMLDENKNKLTGCSVHYLFWGENGEAVMSAAEFDSSKPVGIQRAKCSLDLSARTKIVVAPAIYEGTFEMKVNGSGKAVQQLVDIAYVSHVEIKAKELPGFFAPGMITKEDKAQDAKAAK